MGQPCFFFGLYWHEGWQRSIDLSRSDCFEMCVERIAGNFTAMASS